MIDLLFTENETSFLLIFFSALLIYFIAVFCLRLSGKRSLSQFNIFDFVITVAYGTILSSTILSRDTSVTEGALAFALLVLIQFSIAWIASRNKWFRSLIKGDALVLYHAGNFSTQAMKSSRVSRDEILAAIRSQGIGTLEKVQAVVLETNGKISIIPTSKAGNLDTLPDAESLRWPKDLEPPTENSKAPRLYT